MFIFCRLKINHESHEFILDPGAITYIRYFQGFLNLTPSSCSINSHFYLYNIYLRHGLSNDKFIKSPRPPHPRTDRFLTSPLPLFLSFFCGYNFELYSVHMCSGPCYIVLLCYPRNFILLFCLLYAYIHFSLVLCTPVWQREETVESKNHRRLWNRRHRNRSWSANRQSLW